MKYAIDGNTLTAIADAIRMKTETSGAMTTAEMPGKIIGIVPEDKPVELQSKSVSPSEETETVYPDIDQGYVGLSSVTVEAISKTYVGSGVTRKSAQTYTPKTSAQTIEAGQYLTGEQTISGDTNLIPSNIKSGVNIFGVTGSYTGSGNGTAKPVLQEKIFTPTATGGNVAPDEGFDGLSKVYFRGDGDLIPENVRSGINIFGVTGSYEGTGGVAVQRKAGTFTTDQYGSATVDCGFQPDVVLFTGFQFDADGNDYESQAAVVFPERQGIYSLFTTIYTDLYFYIFELVRTSGGFNVMIYTVDSGGQSFIGNTEFSYVAIKYT